MSKKVFVTPEQHNKKPNFEMKRKKGALWCCYCGDWMAFEPIKKDGYSTYARCEGCSISVEDYYIKTANDLWGMSDAKAKATKKGAKKK